MVGVTVWRENMTESRGIPLPVAPPSPSLPLTCLRKCPLRGDLSCVDLLKGAPGDDLFVEESGQERLVHGQVAQLLVLFVWRGGIQSQREKLNCSQQLDL